MTQLVHTIAGEIPESDLTQETTEQDCGQTISMAREWKYVGKDEKLVEHVGQLVRRDVWVIVKTGFSLAGDTAKI